MRVQFTPAARLQFLAALADLRELNPRAARAFRGKVQKALTRLARYPRSGRPLPEFPDLPHREVIVAPYRFFYRVEGRTVWVVVVWHGSRKARRPPRGAV